MISAPLHPQESNRISALLEMEILDTEDELAFDELTKIASFICGTNIALISLVDNDRQWFKSRVGLEATETPRELAFCSHAILQEEIFEIPNAKKDERFHDNPLVTGDPNIRFYAGAPLVTDNNMPLGTLCVIDPSPMMLNDEQRAALKVLANQVVGQMKLRLQHRRLQRSSKQRDQIFATIAHDLRGPFNGILGYSKLLQKKHADLTPEKLNRMANAIHESGMTVFQLLDQLLDWSKKQMGASCCHLHNLPLQQIVQENLVLLQELICAKNLSFTAEMPNNLMVHADETLTGSVIRNLVANAIKYTPEGGNITLYAHESEEDPEFVKISVSDSGVGIPEDKKSMLFNLPIESENGTSGEVGFGLGLNLCKEFTESQGGKIWFDDQYVEGSSFIFTLKKSSEPYVNLH